MKRPSANTCLPRSEKAEKEAGREAFASRPASASGRSLPAEVLASYYYCSQKELDLPLRAQTVSIGLSESRASQSGLNILS